MNGHAGRHPLRPITWIALCIVVLSTTTAAAAAAQPAPLDSQSGSELLRILTLQDYNTRVVVRGTALLGLAAGVIGTFMLLRRRALVGDAISHATLPGIGFAFLFMTAIGMDGKFLPGLLIGAMLSGLAGVGLFLLIRSTTRIKDDAALGIVLSVFFGAGVALLGVIQKMNTGTAAGLESFVTGKTASMLAREANMIAIAALIVLALSVVLHKEFRLLSFDTDFARSQGWPISVLDAMMMALVIGVTVIGLQSVGLILVLALLIIPPAAARFWTDRLTPLMVLSGLIGAFSGLLGAQISALAPNMPAGAIIVVVAAGFFTISVLAGSRRGLIVRTVQQVRFRQKVAQQHLLRALYELASGKDEGDHSAPTPATWDALRKMRSWSDRTLRATIRGARRLKLVDGEPGQSIGLTITGLQRARQLVRNHRLWELYLIHYADIAPSHVDLNADRIEHVLGHDIVTELEARLEQHYPEPGIPPSPHQLAVES